MSTEPTCETCGNDDVDVPLTVIQDTYFCPPCLKDFGTSRWKGIGSKKPRVETPRKEP